MGIREIAEQFRKRSLSPVELTTDCLARIERLNPKLNAFITVTAESALAAARQAEVEIRRGDWRGPLHGIPLALKDLIDTAGVRTTGASLLFKDRVPAEDAEIVRRLKAAGAVLLGKQNLHEFAYGGSSTVSAFGEVRNAWNREHIGGGSSEIVRLGRNTPASGGPPSPQIRGWASLPLGVVSLAERYGGVRVDRAVYEAMTAEVEVYVRRFAAEHCAGINLDLMHLLGTSGTVTTIAGIHLRLKRYDRRQVDGCWMIDNQVTTVLDELRAMSYDERVASPCIGSERADLVLAGCAILEAIRRVFPCTRLRVADRGLREGMLVEMMRADNVWDGAYGQAS